jgi:dihydrofolate reductase
MTTVFAGVAASLDGYIRSTSGDLSWLNDAMAPGEDYGFAETEARTGAYVIGANAYREMGRVRRRPAGHAAPGARLIDELGVAVVPVVLGDGVPFLGTMASTTQLELIECRPFPSGIVLLNYRSVRS